MLIQHLCLVQLDFGTSYHLKEFDITSFISKACSFHTTKASNSLPQLATVAKKRTKYKIIAALKNVRVQNLLREGCTAWVCAGFSFHSWALLFGLEQKEGYSESFMLFFSTVLLKGAIELGTVCLGKP